MYPLFLDGYHSFRTVIRLISPTPARKTRRRGVFPDATALLRGFREIYKPRYRRRSHLNRIINWHYKRNQLPCIPKLTWLDETNAQSITESLLLPYLQRGIPNVVERWVLKI